jgi:hypothetical protein
MRSDRVVIRFAALEGGCADRVPLVGDVVTSEREVTGVLRLVNALSNDSLVCAAFSMPGDQALPVACICGGCFRTLVETISSVHISVGATRVQSHATHHKPGFVCHKKIAHS